jgi:hypothetical protein
MTRRRHNSIFELTVGKRQSLQTGNSYLQPRAYYWTRLTLWVSDMAPRATPDIESHQEVFMAIHILDQDAPGLANRLRGLKSENRHKVVVSASFFAARGMSDLGANTEALLDRMRACGEISAQEAESAIVLSGEADDRCFKLQEEGAPADVWGKSYSLARLLRGIGVGFGGEPKEDIADAIYEIAKSVDNSAGLLEHIASEIDAAE